MQYFATMEKLELESQFIEWIEIKANEKFQISNPFLLACLDETIELKLNSTFNDIPFHQYYSAEELMKQILEDWKSTANSFQLLSNPNIKIVFRQVPVPDLEEREKLSIELSELVLKVESNH